MTARRREDDPRAPAGRALSGALPGGPTSPARRRKRSTASGRSEYQIHVPRRSPPIQPASRSTFRWCETVGWLTSQQAVSSHAQTGASRGELTEDGQAGGVGRGLQESDVRIGVLPHG